ncbi:MAG: hypothetical protein HY567_03070 [Candidatus Kerfeldbacteria bacterium]|nr:hypothetical protein [Candidatus Kerfeldbacteria bacterium]
MRPLILGIVGEKSSGKAVVGRYIARKYGYPFIVFSEDVLNVILELLDLNWRDHRVQGRLAEALRNTFGLDVVARAVLKQVRQHQRARVIVVDGVRKFGELRLLRRMKNFRLLYVTAPAEYRWRRAFGRNERIDDRVSLSEFRRIETLPHEREIPRIGRLADFQIDNVGSTKELYKKIDAVMQEIPSGH